MFWRFCAEELAELFRCAVFVDGDAYGVLVPVVYLLDYLDDVAAGL